MKAFCIEFDRINNGPQAGGWLCRVWFKVATTNQFTDETHQAFAGSRWWFLAYWRAMREAKALYARLAAKAGDRESLGWAP